MKKYFPFICFILILSFVLPFFPCFSVLTKAEDSVSSDDAYIKWEKDNVDAIRNGLAENGLVISNDYYDSDYYITDSDPNFWKVVAQQWGLDGVDYGKPLSRVCYDYAVSNNITSVYNDCFDSVYNYVNSNVPYYIYHSMPISDFFSYFVFSNPDADGLAELRAFRNWVIPCVNNLDGLSALYCNYYIWAHDTFITNYGSLTDDYNFCLVSGSFGDFPDLEYQTFVRTSDNVGVPVNAFQGSLSLYSSDDYLPYSGLYTHYRGYSGTVSSNSNSSYAYVGFVQDGIYASWHCFAQGCLFVSPDQVGSISFPVFRSSADMQLFYTGRSSVYSFDPSIDITGQDVDLSKLYDVIRKTVSDSKGDIIDAINDVANDYLKDQVELLGDIKNALNDSFGRSWLRKIHDQLADYFPQTIDALADLKDAINNLSFSGGSGGSVDLSTTNSLLSDIYDRLGLMIGPYNGNDFDQNTLNHITNSLANKMPFSIVTDIVVIVALFSHEPVKPDLQVPVPFQPGETFFIDISFYEYARSFVNAFFIILFIVGLLVLTQKIFSGLKG